MQNASLPVTASLADTLPHYARTRTRPAAMTDARADLRERLVKMREELIERLAAEEHLDGGLLSLLGTVGAALRAIDESRP